MSELRQRIANATQVAAAGPLAGDRARPQLPPLARDPGLDPSQAPDAFVARFRAELGKLTGHVYGPHDAEGVAETVLRLLEGFGATAILAWADDDLGCPGLAEALRVKGIDLVRPDIFEGAERDARLAELAALPVGLTGALAGLADTGSIVVASGAGRSRVASLLAPIHIAIVPVAGLHPTMADWLADGGAELVRESANVVAITGPSRTADIELTIVLGVHGPKEVHAVLYNGQPSAPRTTTG
ncbi:MAG: LutC/YkgG family protein [Chloroflexota bacterium]